MQPGDTLYSSSATPINPVSVESHFVSAEPPPPLAARLAFPLVFLALGIALVALFVGVLKINNGTFVYTLDDPYIHLALSDQIRHGNYGLHAGTHAAPSSSILFPFLLAIAAGTPLHPYFPLLINVVSLFFTVEVLRRFLLDLKLGTDPFAVVIQAALLLLITLCFNLVGVVFTGLEHSLHIATVAAIVYGLALFLDRGKLPSWLPAAIILCPLVRYEGMALSLAALLVLALRSQIRAALLTFAVLLALLVGYSAFLIKLGLPPLPSSVLSKSAVAAGSVDGGHFISGLIKNVDFMVTQPSGILLLLLGVVAACICASDFFVTPRSWTTRGLLAMALLAMIAGQALAGRFGWLARYEVYLLVGSAMICIYLWQAAIRKVLVDSVRERIIPAAGLAAGLILFGATYWMTTLQVPLTSNNIYEQQLQMHFFVDRYYRGPVAINDLGLISYRNPYSVLDLGGLGSEQARHLLASHATADDYEAFVAANAVHLVIVYQEWFPDKIPDSWQRVGTMSLSRKAVSAAQSDVQFYVTDAATAVRVREELAAFQHTLPPRVELTIF